MIIKNIVFHAQIQMLAHALLALQIFLAPALNTQLINIWTIAFKPVLLLQLIAPFAKTIIT